MDSIEARGDASGWSPFTLGVAAVGLTLCATSFFVHFLEARTLREISGPALAFTIDGLPALALVYGAYRLHRSGLARTGTRTVLAWTLAGAGIFGGATLASVLIRLNEGRIVGEPAFVLLLSATAGALAGYLGGYNKAQARADARAARRASRTVSFVDGVLRHDLKNDLHAIEGAAEIIEARVGDDQRSEELARQVETIHEKVRESTDLVESAGDIAATLSGDEELETVDLVDLVDDAVERIGTAHQVRITTDLPDSAPVAGNAGLRSVVGNLVENAIEHNDADDPEVTIRIENGGGTTRLQVSDNGSGIPDPRKDELFEPRESGTHGGGLYLAATLVESYGGRMSVSDNDPAGSVFTVELPGADAEVAG